MLNTYTMASQKQAREKAALLVVRDPSRNETNSSRKIGLRRD